MRILYLGNFSARHCTEVHIAQTLNNLGHEVLRVQENFVNDKQLMALFEGIDMFLFTRTWNSVLTLEHLDYLRSKDIPSVSYHLDLYVGLQRDGGLDDDPFWRTDYVFQPDGSDKAKEVFKAKGINAFYMKPGVFKDECYMAKSDGFKRDVAFVGGGAPTGQPHEYGHPEWPYRGQLLKFLEETYGGRYEKFGFPQETIRNHELNQLYADTKVTVGDSLCLDNFQHPYYWSDRACETIGRGGFLIHPYIKGMEEEFTHGETIVFYEYNNWDQLKELIDYYVEHDEEREKIRKAGFEFVKTNCTYENRLSRMLEIVMQEEEKKQSEPLVYSGPAHEVPLKINLGAGEDPTEGFINVDLVDLPGIDMTWNLVNLPYPFDDESADYIKAIDVLEHLPNYTLDNRPMVVAFIEECHRILNPGGTLFIQTPGSQAKFMWEDPTHVRPFEVTSMDFFDPDTPFGQSTGFYSKAKFSVSVEELPNHNIRFTMVKR